MDQHPVARAQRGGQPAKAGVTDPVLRDMLDRPLEQSLLGLRVTVDAAGRTDTIEIEVICAERPAKIVEQNTGARGRRIATGTYTLDQLPSAGTRITFEYAWRQAPLGERLASPLVRRLLRRGNERAMKRLAEQLAARRGTGVTAG